MSDRHGLPQGDVLLKTCLGILLVLSATAGMPCALLAADPATLAPHPQASQVLVLVNSRMPPEAGTSGIGAGEFVARGYAALRGIPDANIVRVSCPTSEAASWREFEETIRIPLRLFLRRHPPADQFSYIVPVYGIPYRLLDAPPEASPVAKVSGLAIDGYLASIDSDVLRPQMQNPYGLPGPDGRRLPFRYWTNPSAWKMYLVTRLDGPSALLSLDLAKKAVRVEPVLQPKSGVGYFDYQHRGCPEDNGGYCSADLTMVRAYERAKALGLTAILNDQSVSGSMFTAAPKTLWAWGWYSGNKISGKYDFVDGAVGAQLTSFSANTLRVESSGAWVPQWIKRGATATWGATAEPYTAGYARGDILLAKFWEGYNYAEAAYLSLPYLNWMMVFIGDPLYAPALFAPKDAVAPEVTRPSVTFIAPAPGDQKYRAEISWRTSSPADSLVEYGPTSESLQPSSHASALTTEHQVILFGLAAGQRCMFRALSRSREGSLGASPLQAFDVPGRLE